MKAHLSKVIVALATTCAVLILISPIQAQRRARAYTKGDVDRIIKRVENRSDVFVGLFDRSLDRSALDGTRREDRLNERARDLERALDDLRREFNRAESYVQTRPEVARCLNIAEGINGVVRSRRLGAATETQWGLLRVELNTLAAVYNLRPLRR